MDAHRITITRTPAGRYTMLVDRELPGLEPERRDETEPGELATFAEAQTLASRWAEEFLGKGLRVDRVVMQKGAAVGTTESTLEQVASMELVTAAD